MPPVIVAASDQPVLTPAGKKTTKTGGAGADTIHADLYGSTIDGMGGGDVIVGSIFSDFLVGGTGDDEIHGGWGIDHIEGGMHNDKLWGDAGHDTMLGGQGEDVMYGGDGNDCLLGGYDNDTLWGNAGNDNLVGQQGDDDIFDGAGRDWVDGDEGADTFFAANDGYGEDVSWKPASVETDYFYGDAGTDMVVLVNSVVGQIEKVELSVGHVFEWTDKYGGLNRDIIHDSVEFVKVGATVFALADLID